MNLQDIFICGLIVLCLVLCVVVWWQDDVDTIINDLQRFVRRMK